MDMEPEQQGRPTAREQALSAAYADMRRIARSLLARDGLRAALQPTDLANEAVIRLLQADGLAIDDRGRLLALAARTMRRVLIDEARKLAAAKRQRPELMTQSPGGASNELIPLDRLDEALAALEQFSPEHAQVVELRFTLGLTVEETATATGLAERTVKRRWQAARTWLQEHLSHDA